ncbi:hypothetical protein GCM10027521_14290 [Amycolatopsis cihanbeyliensis]
MLNVVLVGLPVVMGTQEDLTASRVTLTHRLTNCFSVGQVPDIHVSPGATRPAIDNVSLKRSALANYLMEP